ncbi:hypothetical protein V5O48_013401 [Marasmius crinis-equi]|uniref:Uncharacterized protein n=1 Tax=Marasmius crinis-equi TaxID=585013 RepID=A0ABR3F063_9AGAR
MQSTNLVNAFSAYMRAQLSDPRRSRNMDKACQLKDWPSHKPYCVKSTVWYDWYRACEDGGLHEGKLELMTWDYSLPEFEMELGFGGATRDQADHLKEIFESDLFGGDLEKFYKYRPNAFRWTCCGAPGDVKLGCDHHGKGNPRKPCSCDFCSMGKSLTDKAFNEAKQSKHGLDLIRGPDPRSYNPAVAMERAAGRSLFGLDG